MLYRQYEPASADSSLPRFSIKYFLCKTFNQVIPIEIVDSEPGKESSILSVYRSELFGLNVDVS